jgi:hypothetical protein
VRFRRSHRIIDTLFPIGNRHELWSKSGRLLAWYDRNTAQTFTSDNKQAGYGDQTAKFIPED